LRGQPASNIGRESPANANGNSPDVPEGSAQTPGLGVPVSYLSSLLARDESDALLHPAWEEGLASALEVKPGSRQ
jgi:hypothetical protein